MTVRDENKENCMALVWKGVTEGWRLTMAEKFVRKK